jgi:hypothetical protein
MSNCVELRSVYWQRLPYAVTILLRPAKLPLLHCETQPLKYRAASALWPIERENRDFIAKYGNTQGHMPAAATIGADSQILNPINAVGDGRRTHASVKMVAPQFFTALGIEGAEIAVHFSCEDQIARSGEYAAKHGL